MSNTPEQSRPQEVESGRYMQKVVLVADGDHAARRVMVRGLDDEGFSVDAVDEPEGIKRIAKKIRPDIVIADPQTLNTPIEQLKLFNKPLIVTSFVEESDESYYVVESLHRGADFFLPKPTKPYVVAAHINAALRRYELNDRKPTIKGRNNVRIDFERGRVFVGDTEADLTRGDRDLLFLLAKNGDKVLTLNQIKDALELPWWNSEDDIRVRVARLRTRIGDTDKSNRTITTHRGEGYSFPLEDLQ